MDDLPKQLAVIAFLLLIKGLLTAIATSFTVLGLKKAKYIAEGNTDLDSILENSQKKINACSLANAMMGVLVGFLLSFAPFLSLSELLFLHVGNKTLSDIISGAVIIVLAAFFFALLGILLPKLLATRYPDKIIKRFNWLTVATVIVFKPLSILIDAAYSAMSAFFGAGEEPEEDVSEEEILVMLDAGEEQGSIDKQEQEMINNIFEFDDKTVGEICTHRKDIVALCESSTPDEVIKIISEEKFSRIPVYDGDIDNITGVLHVKDFMHKVLVEGQKTPNIGEIAMEPYFVPYTKKTDELFHEMQHKKIHLAVVTDEYGGTEGIVTMEDLIEEVMGEIQDEYDEEETPDIVVLNNDRIIMEGSVPLEDVASQLEIELPTEEYDTLAGFLIAMLDRVPDEDEKNLRVEYAGHIFEIDEIEENRISRVIVRKCEQKPKENEEQQ